MRVLVTIREGRSCVISGLAEGVSLLLQTESVGCRLTWKEVWSVERIQLKFASDQWLLFHKCRQECHIGIVVRSRVNFIDSDLGLFRVDGKSTGEFH